MKNTVKKILALVFVVAMVCSLAVPAFAAEFEEFNVEVVVVKPDGTTVGNRTTVTVKAANKANVLETLKAVSNDATHDAKFTFKNNVLTAVADKAGAITTTNAFETEDWIVALNGKAINDDLSTVAVAKDDVIVVYWADATVGTKLAMYDDSAIAQGIVSFYYYDAEGVKQPLVGLTVRINGVKNKLDVTATNPEGEATAWSSDFVTDEKGQIWISPEYLDKNVEGRVYVYKINTLTKDFADEMISEVDGYTKAEEAFFNTYIRTSIVTADVVGQNISYEAGMYDVAGATGDMTIVYVLVAVAAVVTLGAVVIMKKKAVKAN